MTSQTPNLNFPIVDIETTPVIQMPERLSILEAVGFKETYQQLLDQKPFPDRIVLDFSQTKFMDSSGVGALVSSLKVTRERNVDLVLSNVRPPVMAVLEMTGLDSVFKIKSDVSEAKLMNATRAENNLPDTHPSIRSWLKRTIDIAGALVGLTILAAIFIPVAIAIKTDSPGPIFFKQTRCGWMGKKFEIWKFRSMCVDAEFLKSKIENQASGAFFKNDNDPRITEIGRFLRRTSLDEFPQFWNVLKGDMSLVGTRPPTPDEVENYQVPQWQRLDVKPGMTGEWQVNGRSQVRNFEDVIKLDIRYQENWSLRYDLKLILKTLSVIFNKNSGAV
jgi:exopolysaccharide biosynthesis polyprenyl glycosylphosphotransferase